MIVVDASLFVAWLLNESRRSSEDRVWDLLEVQSALVPMHWPNEVANALRRSVRTKRLAEAEIGPIVSRLAVFDIRMADPPQIAHITSLVEQSLANDLSVYDLQYIRLALAHRAPLATIDAGMRRAASRLKLDLLPA